MPRRSYAAHRALRGTSAADSETDLESLASFSTFQSSSTFLTGESSSISHRLASGSRTYSPAPSTPLLEVPHNGKHARPERDPEREERRRRHRERKNKLKAASERYDSPLRRWLRWMSNRQLSRWSLPIGLAGVMVLKTAVGFGGFSGKDTPPMYGDFEAQRHWMEVTIHRPLAEWYTYAQDWWLLDYPPLTAYASWLCGKTGSYLDPTWFALDTSWGTSPPDLITFMRFSVITFEALVWWTAVVTWVITQGRTEGRSWRGQMTGIMTILLQPALTLVDNGHFQYNSVLLGFSLWTMVFLVQDQDVLACITFSLALCFKQMGLYYAPAVGCFLLNRCLRKGGLPGYSIWHLIKLGVTTAATFTLMFLPWLQPFPSALLQVLHRIFPFSRGIFEDKVANFWCASNVVVKWRNWFSIAAMARLATVATLVALLPTIYLLFHVRSTQPEPRAVAKSNGNTHAPSKTSSKDQGLLQVIPMAMFTSSMAFFLFSFQVHEKSILLPLMPLTVMMAARGGKDGSVIEDEIWAVGVLLNNVAVFSMWPLLKRDDQTLQYIFVTLLWNFVLGYNPTSASSRGLRFTTYLTYTAVGLLHLPDIFPGLVRISARYPDILAVLNAVMSFAVFGVAWLWGLRLLHQPSS